jgi:hypothetical protein
MVLWFAFVWHIWKLRNKILFQGKWFKIEELVEVVMITSWNWLPIKGKGVYTQYLNGVQVL